jgi:small subunit ribosomal protein S1
MSIKFCQNFDKNDFAKLLKKYNYKFNIGDIFAGKIIGFEKSICLVDIGCSIVSVLPLSEVFLFQSFLVSELFSIYQINEFLLLNYDIENKLVIITLKKLKFIRIWQQLKILIQENLIISSQVEKSTKRGKLVTINGLKAFIANSHLPKYYRRRKLIKLNLPAKFIQLSESNNKIFLSCKLAHFKNQSNFLKLKQSIYGCITQVKPYGLFINIFGLKGLLHISGISTKRIEDINKLYKKGQLINVSVSYININGGRIILSVKTYD